MRKKLFIFFILVFALGNISVFAEAEEQYLTFEPVKYAKTYVESEFELFSAEKTLEQTLIEGWGNLSSEISVKDYNILRKDVGDIYCGILFENPEFYYVSSGFECSCEVNDDDPDMWRILNIIPIYTETDKTVIEETIQAIDEATEEILLYIDESMTDFEKIMTVHDYMVLHYEYDYSLSNYDIRIMTTKKGVCMAYSMAFKHLMNKIGIDCLYVASDERMNHGWNLVKLADRWYHIDLTWDDPGTNFGQVRHTYALLSDEEIMNLNNPHYGYDLGGLEANSDKYDKEHWHKGVGSIVTIDKIYYYVDDNNLVDQNGKIIYENLNGDGYWDIGGGYVLNGESYAGIAEYNGMLYFNTDQAVLKYNPKDGKTTKLLEYDGICGLFIDRNKLEYCKYGMDEERFVEAGSYNLGKIRFGGTFHDNGKIIKRIYREADAENINVYAHCKDCVHIERITKAGVSNITFDTKECQSLFYWSDELKPLKEKEIYD